MTTKQSHHIWLSKIVFLVMLQSASIIDPKTILKPINPSNLLGPNTSITIIMIHFNIITPKLVAIQSINLVEVIV